MTRWVSSTNETEAAKQSVSLRTLVDLDFPSGTVRGHDGVGDIVHSSNTYTGLSGYGGMQSIREDVQGGINAVKLILAGPTPIMTTALTEAYQGRDAIIYVGLVNEAGAWVATAEEIWRGKMDVMEVEIGKEVSVITLTCETRLRKEPRVARYTDTDQQLLYPGDKFFEFVSRIPGFKVTWGAKGYGVGLGSNSWNPVGVGGGSGPIYKWDPP
jgi:hypothetical protein